MAEPMTKAEIRTLREWVEHWGPDPDVPVPVGKETMTRLLDAADRGVDGYLQDAISHTEAHGVREPESR